MLIDQLAERGVIHVLGEKLLILFHAVDEESFKSLLKHEAEILFRVRVRGLYELFVRDRFLANLVEEQLVGCLRPVPHVAV